MFNIETLEDVQILKELTKNEDNERIRMLEQEVSDLKETIRSQNMTINSLQKADTPLTRTEIQKLITDAIKGASTKVTKNKRVPVVRDEREEFVITPGLIKHKVVAPYNKIFVQGNTLIHKSVSNHENKIPISTVQFLLIVEKFTKNKNKISIREAQKICNLCDISKNQFAKIYYNLKEGHFFNTIEAIDTQIKQTNFIFKNGYIHIKKGGEELNTGIDKKTFNHLVNVYINSNTPYLTIYKLSREYSKINPIFLLTVLRKNDAVSKSMAGKK